MGGFNAGSTFGTQNHGITPQENRKAVMTEQVLKRVVPWETYQKADLISDRELQLIKRYDKKDGKVQLQLLEAADDERGEGGVSYVNAFFSLLRSIASEEVVQYVLALLEQMIVELGGSKCVLGLFKRASVDVPTILLRMLQRPDSFTQEKAAFVLANYLSFDNTDVSDQSQTMNTFIEWLCQELRSSSASSSSQVSAGSIDAPCVISCLSTLLRNQSARTAFVRYNGITPLVVSLDRAASQGGSLQVLYESCLCTWFLSFQPAASRELTRTKVPQKLTDVAKHVQKEKILRVALMTIQNCLERDGSGSGKGSGGQKEQPSSPSSSSRPGSELDLSDQCGSQQLLIALVEYGLPKVIQAHRSLGCWSDEELLATIEWLDAKLEEGMRLEVTMFDKYANEVATGALEWTILHKEESFWRMNVNNFTARKGAVLRSLVALLDPAGQGSGNPRTLAIACHDLGQFIIYHPNGRNILKNMGEVKTWVMQLMTHQDPEVQKQALMCTQKLMVSKDSLDLLTMGVA